MDKAIIERNFSRCARFYDRYADIQRLAAERLIGLAPDAGFKEILEIGCGTGNYTIMLREKFRTAHIKAIEISEEMVGIARLKTGTAGVEFVIADAEKIDLSAGFDLVTSNASFQWFENMESSIKRYKEILSAGGVILFSSFGPLTFLELGRVLKDVAGGQMVDSSAFQDKDALTGLLKRHFRGAAVEELTVKETYPSLRDLLGKIKYTGTRGSGLGNALLWRKGMFEKVEETYKNIFGAIEATYQLFFCKGIK